MTGPNPAQRMYKARQNEIAELIAQLEAQLETHEHQAMLAGITYAHDGDLGHVAGQLEDLIAFMQGQPDEQDKPLASGKGWVVANV